MLADEAYSQLVQAIGQASLHADQKQLWHLTKIYWWASFYPQAVILDIVSQHCLKGYCQIKVLMTRNSCGLSPISTGGRLLILCQC